MGSDQVEGVVGDRKSQKLKLKGMTRAKTPRRKETEKWSVSSDVENTIWGLKPNLISAIFPPALCVLAPLREISRVMYDD